MSNRFNKPEMLKANRKRYFDTAVRNQTYKAAKRMIEIEEEAEERRRMEREEAEAYARSKQIRIRRRKPWGERFMDWVTGC